MRQRGVPAEVKTWTVIFSGCARLKTNVKAAVPEVVKLYYSLLEDERVEMNSIHLNAVLAVCARAYDIDSLFAVLSTVNDTTRLPDKITYHTILMAIYKAIGPDLTADRSLSTAQVLEIRMQAVMRSKAVWEDCMAGWKAGRIEIDERLVIAMGLIYLWCGDPKQMNQVLDLIHDTMAVPKIYDEQQKAGFSPSKYRTAEMKGISEAQTGNPVPGSGVRYAIPGRPTLSLVLQALARGKLTTSAIGYWNLMVVHYGITPDMNNWTWLTQTCVAGRASGRMLDVLSVMPRNLIEPRVFRMAVFTCLTDISDQNVYQNAARIVDLMLEILEGPDITALGAYIDLVEQPARRKVKPQTQSEIRAWKLEHSEIVYDAMKRISPSLNRIIAALMMREESMPIITMDANTRREAIEAARKLSAILNRVGDIALLPADQLREVRKQRKQLDRVVKFFHDEYSSRSLEDTRPPEKLDLRAELDMMAEDDLDSKDVSPKKAVKDYEPPNQHIESPKQDDKQVDQEDDEDDEDELEEDDDVEIYTYAEPPEDEYDEEEGEEAGAKYRTKR